MSDYAAMAQSVERRLGKAEVTGSSPVSSLEKRSEFRNAFFIIFYVKIKSKSDIAYRMQYCSEKDTKKELFLAEDYLFFPEEYFFKNRGLHSCFVVLV